MKFQEKRLISRETIVSSRSLVGLSAAIICLVHFDVSLEDFRPMGLKTSSENWRIIAVFAVGFLFINHMFKFYIDYLSFKRKKLSSKFDIVSLTGEKIDLRAEIISSSNTKMATTNFESNIPAPNKDNEKLDQLRIEAMERGEEAILRGQEAILRGQEAILRGQEAMERGHEYQLGLFEQFLVITLVEKFYFFGWYLCVPSGCAIWAAYLLLKPY
jgi:hypothetical protein